MIQLLVISSFYLPLIKKYSSLKANGQNSLNLGILSKTVIESFLSSSFRIRKEKESRTSPKKVRLIAAQNLENHLKKHLKTKKCIGLVVFLIERFLERPFLLFYCCFNWKNEKFFEIYLIFLTIAQSESQPEWMSDEPIKAEDSLNFFNINLEEEKKGRLIMF